MKNIYVESACRLGRNLSLCAPERYLIKTISLLFATPENKWDLVNKWRQVKERVKESGSKESGTVDSENGQLTQIFNCLMLS